MENLWHAVVLETVWYGELQAALGFTFHHRSSGSHDQESEQRENRLLVMKCIYNTYFGAEPVEAKPPPITLIKPEGHLREPQINIWYKNFTGRRVAVKLHKQATIQYLMIGIEEIERIATCEQCLVYGSKHISDWDPKRTLVSCGIHEDK